MISSLPVFLFKRKGMTVVLNPFKSPSLIASIVTFGILIVVGRLEGTNSLAHERKVARQGADGEDERLVRIESDCRRACLERVA